ncbi:hypothetical protein GGI35DRAFT_477346 [Trichoderma velutinum]
MIVDEAGRLTEAMSLVPFAQHADAPVIFIGDTKQCGPMAVTSTDKKYKALFEAQSRRSLLKRNNASDKFLTYRNLASAHIQQDAKAYYQEGNSNSTFTKAVRLLRDDRGIKFEGNPNDVPAAAQSRFIMVVSSTAISQRTSIAQVILAPYHRCSFSTSVTLSKTEQHNSRGDLTTYTPALQFRASPDPVVLHQRHTHIHQACRSHVHLSRFLQPAARGRPSHFGAGNIQQLLHKASVIRGNEEDIIPLAAELAVNLTQFYRTDDDSQSLW